MTLATMATKRLNQQSPELSKYIVAFKDLSDELPENTGVQVGMFILNIADKYIYIPAVSKAGNVQTLESMFDADSKTFIPITKKSVKWMIDKGCKLGTAERIPSTVARDPDLKDAIVPPRTGKFVYASEGRVSGFFATLPNIVKKATLTLLDSDYDLQSAIAKVMDIDLARECLERETPEYVPPAGPAAPIVVTSAEGLTEDQVQEIMAKGYIVKNPPNSRRVAVESSDSALMSLTNLSNLMPGTAAMAMKKDGSWVGVASLRMAKKYTNDSLTSDSYDPCRNYDTEQDTSIVAITEEGNTITDPKVIISAKECDYQDIMTRLKSKKATEVDQGDVGFIFTGTSFYGPLTARQVVKANGWTTISTDDHEVCIHPGVKTLLNMQGARMILSDVAMFYPTKGPVEMEHNLSMAEMKANIEMERMLPYQSTLMHRNGVYAVDGKEIGGKPQIVEHLLKSWEIDVPSVETFVKKAEQNNSVIVKMAAVGSTGSKVQPHYQHGEQPLNDTQMTGNARQRAIGMASSVKNVQDVKDREIMEATIISEMLQNPDLEGSINEYLPDIHRAVDRLGRSLFLMRINTDKLSDKMDAEALNSILTATRNAYRILGENYVTLQNLVANDL